MSAENKFREMYDSSKAAHENFKDFSSDRAIIWAYEELQRLRQTDAPALLDALADLLAYLEDGIGDCDSEEGKKARALIAKHKGKV